MRPESPSALSRSALPPRRAFLWGVGLCALVLLASCGGPQPPEGELREIQDAQHRVRNPAVLGASATGRGCGVTLNEALTKARRVAQFNLRSLTGSARYKVRYDLVDETEDAKGFCVVLSATSIPPLPFER